MNTKEEAQEFIEYKANKVNKEVSFIVEVDADGNEYYFIEPWNENSPKISKNRSISASSTATKPQRAANVTAHGRRVTEQHHYGPDVNKLVSVGGMDDMYFALKYGVTVYHHNSIGYYEYPPNMSSYLMAHKYNGQGFPSNNINLMK
jgi:hypothetical protein